MSATGFLLLATVAAAPAPDGLTVGAPRLARGDELVYVGHVEEAGERVGNRFRKRHELEVRVFVLEVAGGAADCAVLTRVRPLLDPAVAGPAAVVTGADPARQASPAAVRLDLIRVDPRGRVALLTPPTRPLSLTTSTPTAPPPLLPLDAPPAVELGPFVPLPAKPAALGTVWDSAEPGRPPLVWAAARETVWNGGRCVEVTAAQQSDGWDRPDLAATGWKRTDAALVVPTDGFASAVTRRVERREGAMVIGWVEVSYEAKPTARLHGDRYDDERRDAEAAYALATELAPLLPRAGKVDAGEFRARVARIDRYVEDHPFRTGFREAIAAVRRRCEAAARGEAIPAEVVRASYETPSAPPAAGHLAPDFVAPDVGTAAPFRLSAHRGAPVVLVFFRPGSKTSEGALRVAEALHVAFAGRAVTAAIAVSGPEDARRQRGELKQTLPVLDGRDVRARYGVDQYPKVFVIDGSGLVVWRFEGYGQETGYLAKREVERLVK